MLKKSVILLLAGLVILSCAGFVGAAEETVEVLYEMDLSNYNTVADTGMTPAVASQWSIGMGSEGRKCLIGKDTDNQKLIMAVGEEDWIDYTVEMEFKILQTETPEESGVGMSLYTRSIGSVTTGSYFKYMFRNPAYYSNYFGGYRAETNTAPSIINNTWKSGPDTSAAIQTNAIQKIQASVTNANGTDGATITQTVTLNDGYTTTDTRWYGTGAMYGKSVFEFFSSNKVATFEVYSYKVIGTRKPIVYTYDQAITYNIAPYVQDFNNCASVEDTGMIPAVASQWSIGMGSEGRKCLIGKDTNNQTLTMVVGEEDWIDYTVEMEFKILQTETPEESGVGMSLYTRSIGSVTTGSYFKYMFRNPVYYSNYFGGYRAELGKGPAIINNTWKSGSDPNAAIQTNTMQRLKADITNSPSGTGANITQTVTLNDIYTTTDTRWWGAGSMKGKIAFQCFSNNKVATFEIYSFKITHKNNARTSNIVYTRADDSTPVTSVNIPAGGQIRVSGNIEKMVVNDTVFAPVLVCAVYDGDKLYDISFVKVADNEFKKTIDATLSTPQDVSNCKIKTFIWDSFYKMHPLYNLKPTKILY